jgi:hypothetical protein
VAKVQSFEVPYSLKRGRSLRAAQPQRNGSLVTLCQKGAHIKKMTSLPKNSDALQLRSPKPFMILYLKRSESSILS